MTWQGTVSCARFPASITIRTRDGYGQDYKALYKISRHNFDWHASAPLPTPPCLLPVCYTNGMHDTPQAHFHRHHYIVIFAEVTFFAAAVLLRLLFSDVIITTFVAGGARRGRLRACSSKVRRSAVACSLAPCKHAGCLPSSENLESAPAWP